MVSLGEAYRALGAGATASYESRAKELKDLQRQQLLMAALTPLAQNLGASVTDFISEPFRQAASDFYSLRNNPQGVGAGFTANVKALDTIRNNYAAQKAQVDRSANGGLDFLEHLCTPKAKDGWINSFQIC